MMKNFTQKLKTTILLSVLVLMAITVKAQSGNYFVKHDGAKINIYGEAATVVPGGVLEYIDENGKDATMKVDDIKLLVMGKSVLMRLPNSPKSKSTILDYIVAFNDDYVLAANLSRIYG